jgi:putative FmdB family regulatory protein
MPIYNYSCPKCKHSFDELVKDQKEKVACPRCKAKAKKTMQGLGRTVFQPYTRFETNWR